MYIVLHIYSFSAMFPLYLSVYIHDISMLNACSDTVCGSWISYFVCLVLWLLLRQELPLGVGNLAARKHTGGKKRKEACQLQTFIPMTRS